MNHPLHTYSPKNEYILCSANSTISVGCISYMKRRVKYMFVLKPYRLAEYEYSSKSYQKQLYVIKGLPIEQ